MPSTTTQRMTGDPRIDGLLSGVKWGVRELTFSFPDRTYHYGTFGYGYGAGEPRNNFEALNAAQRETARSAFDMYSSVSDLTFSETVESWTRHGDLRLALTGRVATAWSYYPSPSEEGGDSWFSSVRYYNTPVKGDYAFATFMHEIGHALGLDHPHDGTQMPSGSDSIEYSVMSYRSYVGGPTTGGYTNEAWGYAQSPMMYDIAALQEMYGANYDTNSGNTTYSWNPTTGQMYIDGAGQGAPGANRILLTVWDGGGVDTYDFSNYQTPLDIDLGPGAWTTTSRDQLVELHASGSPLAAGNIANALLHDGDPRSLIENARGGSAADTITGNGADNVLSGNAGDDHLFGGAGDDTLVGGAGRDTLDGGAGFDLAGYGEATAGVTARLDRSRDNTGEAAGDRYESIEGLVGSAFNDVLIGDAGANRLAGGAGADWLSGRHGDDVLLGGAGGDMLSGGVGNDRLIGGAGADWLWGGAGRDSFVFVEADLSDYLLGTISDFEPGLDRIDLSAIDADEGEDGDQAFSFVGDEAFGGTAGELTCRGGVLAGDTDGDRAADFEIHVMRTPDLVAGDLIV